jgi:hypothetical protein
MIGDSNDILSRVKRLIPNGWFSYVAPNRDAIMGAASDLAAWCYSWIGYAKAQSRLATAYGVWLDIWANDFLGSSLVRGGAQDDDTFRALVKATILRERVTRAGMIQAMKNITGHTPSIFEPWNTGDTGAYSSQTQKYGSMGYGVGQGGYGNMGLPAQTFMQIHRGGPSGIPFVGGYGDSVGGYGVGVIEYAGPIVAESGITNDMILKIANLTKPTGSTVWAAFD